MKKISEYKVQKRCVALRFTQVKFPKDRSHELTTVKILIPMSLLHMAQEYHLSHSFFTSITNLLTGCSRYRRTILVVPDVPSMSLTLLTNPFSSIFAIGQLFRSAAASLSSTISPTLQFLLMVFNFC